MNIEFHCDAKRSLGDEKCAVRAFLYTDYSIPPHNHEFYEMNIVLRGVGTHEIENSRFRVKAGDVFVIPPMTVHAYCDTRELDVYHILIRKNFITGNMTEAASIPGFLQLVEIEPFLRRHFSDAMFLHLGAGELVKLRGELAFIEDGGEFDREELYPLKHHSLWKILYSLSYMLYRQLHSSKKDTKNKYEHSVLTALEYIHQNYFEKITIEDLCAITYLSRSTLLRSFGEICGCSPTVYLGRYRCERAAELMNSAAMSKTEIANACGFYDLSHMERMLKNQIPFSLQ